MKTIAVVGAGGHVGLPFSLVLANAGFKVIGLDINQDICDTLNAGKVPYIETGAEELLLDVLNYNSIKFTTDTSELDKADIFAIMMGTPVDEENNPRLDAILDFIKSQILPRISTDSHKMVMLRSTVSPGTTDIIRKILESTGFKESKDFYLVFCPERVAQGKSIEESKKLPQIVGAYSHNAFEEARKIFDSFIQLSPTCRYLYPKEAELAKLMTNMYRYVNFALANEFYMIAESQGADIHRIIEAANYEYPRANIPLPGPNVGGPCLFKDGKFLLTDVPYSDLIQTSFNINESMPDHIFNEARKLNPDMSKVLILGAAFKANVDDTRHSLSFKLKKVCKKHGIEVDVFDPHTGHNIDGNYSKYDAVFFMTPHDIFKDYWPEIQSKLADGVVIADLWKVLHMSKNYHNGVYKFKRIMTNADSRNWQ